MKGFNWGHGIIIFFILYIGYLVGTVIISRDVDHSLVVDNYYQHDIAYQELYYDATENRNKLVDDLSIVLDDQNQTVALDFGMNQNGISGVILFYRPSDKGSDVTDNFQMKAPQSILQFSTSALLQGKWIVKIRWDDGERSYYKEEDIII